MAPISLLCLEKLSLCLLSARVYSRSEGFPRLFATHPHSYQMIHLLPKVSHHCVVCESFFQDHKLQGTWNLFKQKFNTSRATSENKNTLILQNFGVVLFSVISVANGFTEIKKTPEWEKHMEWSRQHPRTPKFKLNRTLHDRSLPKF